MAKNTPLPDRVAMERAILETVLYSDLFDYPLTPDEIAHYLIGVPADSEAVRARLNEPVWLDGQIARVDGFVMARGREMLVRQRHERTRSSMKLWRRAHFFVRALSCLPFVRMVGVTGALSMDNSHESDDVDVMIVTAPNRVWLTRSLSLLLVRVGRLFRNTLCPNYLLSEEVLPLERRSLYTAHEFVQMVPLYGLEVYERLRAANRWTAEILPNAGGPFRPRPEHQPGLIGRTAKELLEHLLSGRLGDRFENWEMRRKLTKFLPELVHSGGCAVITKDQVKGHFQDHGRHIIDAYQRRLEEFRLDTLTQAGESELPIEAATHEPDKPGSLCSTNVKIPFRREGIFRCRGAEAAKESVESTAPSRSRL